MEERKLAMKRLVAALVTAAVLVGLSACSFSTTVTEKPENLAANVKGELEAQYDVQGIEINCGTDRISVVVDTVVVCTMTVTDDPDSYEVVVTITEVDGTNYKYTYELRAA